MNNSIKKLSILIVAISVALTAVFIGCSRFSDNQDRENLSDSFKAAGTDSNKNDIRDDVEEKIKETYGYDPNLVKAANQLAKSLQKSVTESKMSEARAIEISGEISRAQECLYQLADVNSGFDLKVEEWVVNNAVRTKNYIHFNALLSGNDVPLNRPYCDFKVEE